MLTKIIRIGLWALVPFLFASHTGLEIRSIDSISRGAYKLRSVGAVEGQVYGKARYDLAHRFSHKEGHYSILRLQLENVSAGSHSMEFVICLKETDGRLLKGTFGIARDIDGFSNYFTGVFGVAHGSVFGEQLFFAKTGKLTVIDVDDAVLSGKIDMTLSNSDGRTIEVEGDFIASR